MGSLVSVQEKGRMVDKMHEDRWLMETLHETRVTLMSDVDTVDDITSCLWTDCASLFYSIMKDSILHGALVIEVEGRRERKVEDEVIKDGKIVKFRAGAAVNVSFFKLNALTQNLHMVVARRLNWCDTRQWEQNFATPKNLDASACQRVT